MECNPYNYLSSQRLSFPPASGGSSSGCLAPCCWRVQLTLQSAPLPRAPHQNQAHLFFQTPPQPTTLHWEVSAWPWSWHQYPLAQCLCLLALEGNVSSSLKSFLPWRAGGWATLLCCSTGRNVKMWTKCYWGIPTESLLLPLEQHLILGQTLPYGRFVDHVCVVPAVHKECHPILWEFLPLFPELIVSSSVALCCIFSLLCN